MKFAREQRALLFVGADESPAQIAQLVLDQLAVGDVAENAEGADRLTGGVALADARQVVDPDLPTGRVQEAILDERIGPSFRRATVSR